MTTPNLATNRIRKLIVPALVLATMVTTGCASRASNPATADSQEAISATDGPTVESVIKQPGVHQKSNVRWGGTVVGVENREDDTWIEVVDRPLDEHGRPVESRLSHGRFLAVVPEFLDPVDYRIGRVITVSGTLDGSDTRQIGGADFDYPKVIVADHQLWQSSDSSVQVAGYNKYGHHHPFYRSNISIGFGIGSRFGHGGRFFGRSSVRFGGRRGFRSRGFRSGRGFRGSNRRFRGGRGFRSGRGFRGRR